MVFARISEKRMRVVRGLLVIGWIVLIVSLLWDPYSSALTRPDNRASPFRLDRSANAGDRLAYACPLRQGTGNIDWRGQPEGTCDPRCPRVQERCIIEQPYPMGARLFWTLILPIVPFFLMIFGHEAWRRLCPLSALMQIPRRLGIQHKRKTVNSQTGLIDAKLLLPRKKSWLSRNFWYLQFALLWLGLSARLLFINSDRTALAIFFIAVIAIAMIVGYFYGGKTWCNYICPLSPVQKIYTEPRGLFESQAHTAGSTITQSMCRNPGRGPGAGDISACVGCKSPCPDTDLERQYWTELSKPGRRFFYYGYFGLVLGFYTYYRLYAGNWDYYFSGAWTHEEEQLSTLLSPGLYLLGRAIPIPKLVAAPLVLLLFILGAYATGVALELLYRRWRSVRGAPLSEEGLRHRCFTASALLTINCFYLFGGRPNLALLPRPVLWVVDSAIIGLSVAWAVRTWWRSSESYQRESVVESLRRQLGKLKLDFEKMFGGRSLNELSSDEVYVLAKTLPDLSQQERRRAYKDTVREALASGHGSSGAGLAVLREIREQMDISEEEHNAVLAELGIEDHSLLDPDEALSQEERLRLTSYREAIEGLMSRWLEQGVAFLDALRDEGNVAEIRRLQTLYSISPEEQERVLDDLADAGDIGIKQARELIEEIERLASWKVSFGRSGSRDADGSPADLWPTLMPLLAHRRRRLVDRALVILAGILDEGAAARLAERLAAAAFSDVKRALGERTVEGEELEFPALVIEALAKRGEVPTIKSVNRNEALVEIARTWEPVARAIALAALYQVDRQRAHAIAESLSDPGPSQHWLVDAVARRVRASEEMPAVLERLRALYASPFFNHLDPDSIALFARAARTRNYRAGGELFRAGAPSDELVYVIRGQAEAFVERESGEVRVGTVEAGQTVGELGVFTKNPRTATVRAGAGGLEVLTIDGSQLEHLFAVNGRAATSFLRMTGERLATTLAQVG